ncbi:BatD family protein [Robertkochia solimangrovi]|uniref:BatD family protein n=1 Tax=Robertkochia solimangrovi TaxID=2213046 RepID=UPI00117C1E9F|nr:BatD family protein [Robertkochia solimangrovi]TRZ45875.1 protein BatD [Robertkochia solimangrovi]
MKLKAYILLFLILTGFAGYSQEDAVEFNASVSKSKLGVNERLRIDFAMNKDGDNFTPPNFEGFRVLMGPNQSISNQWANGKRSYSKTYSYILTPLEKGNFTIKQATVEIGGETYKTLPLNIEVTAAVDNPNAPKSPEDIAAEKLHLVAEVSDSKPYMNEAVSVEYKLYVSPDVNLYDYIPIDNPKYNNFWSQNIEIKRLRAENAIYEGKQYRVVVLKKVVLYPQKSGKLEIEPLTLEVKVEVPTNRRDIFGGRVFQQANQRVTAGKKVIDVKALPEKGKPADFTGAVGNFQFDVLLSKSDLKANESLTARMVVSGSGNLKLFDLPKLTLPSALEVYEPEFEEQVSTYITGMRGKVTESYTIVPQYKGKYPVASVSFSYFDPKEEKYKSISSAQALINVYEGPSSGTTVANTNDVNTKQPVVADKSQFRFLKLDANLSSKVKGGFFNTSLYYVLLLGPLLLIPIAIGVGKKRKAIAMDVEGNRVRKANKLARKYLSEARKNLGSQESFYESLERALHNYLKAKLKITTTELSKDRIRELLSGRSVKLEETEAFIGILNSCELARYTPSTVTEMENDYEKAAGVISRIDKQIV